MSYAKIGLLVLLAAASANAQGGGSAVLGFGNVRFAPPAVSGAPYSGEQVSESVQVLADGTRITRKTAGQKMFRDFAGRTRVERLAFPRPEGAPVTPVNDIIVVEIYDPILGLRYTLDTVNHVAHRQKMEPFPPLQPPPAVSPSSTPLVPAPPADAPAVSTRPRFLPILSGRKSSTGCKRRGTGSRKRSLLALKATTGR